METIAKVIKAIFFNDNEVDLSVATKCKYIVYGIIITLAAELVYVCVADDETETDSVEQVEED